MSRASAAETGYADRKVAEITAGADIAIAGIGSTEHVIEALIDTAKANPIMGIVLAVVTADVLCRAHVIRPQTEAFIFTVCGVAFGVEIGLEAVEGVASLVSSITGGGTTAPDPSLLVRPSPTTMVTNPPPPPAPTRQGPPLGALLGAAGKLPV